MIERLLLAAVLVAVLLGVIALVRFWLRQRDRRIVRRLRSATREGEGAPRDVPRIVYFTTKTCLMCRTMQEPALDRLAGEFGPVVIEQHDAIEEAALAAEYGVFSTPTTAVYDHHDRLVTINRGFADVDRLMKQLDEPHVHDEVIAVGAAG